MSRFNQPTPKQATTTNNAGGAAYAQSSKMALVGILLTSFGNESFYSSSDRDFQRLKDLLSSVDPEFAAKAAIYARSVFGMRTITHVIAAELAKYLGGRTFAKKFYQDIVVRPDDITEILSYYKSQGNISNKGKIKLAKAMQIGLGKAFNKFDHYQLAKYRSEDKEISLVDAVNLLHPKPTEKNHDPLAQLVKGELRSIETWESKLSEAGNSDNVEGAKFDVWEGLIRAGKISQLALLRNLRNIAMQAPSLVAEACLLLTDERRVRDSRIYPFQYFTAYEQIQGQLENDRPQESRMIQLALASALDRSCGNIQIPGTSLVCVDDSGSMRMARTNNGRDIKSCADTARIFAALLLKITNADFLTFNSAASMRTYDITQSALGIAKNMTFSQGGTRFASIFERINRRYDNIFILSDMQGWEVQRDGNNLEELRTSFDRYKRLTLANPMIYSWDLSGLGTLQFPNKQTRYLAGFSTKVFELLPLIKDDSSALVSQIEKIQF